MSSVDIVIPTGRGLLAEAHNYLIEMMRATNCNCGDHEPWRCPNGKHSVRLVPSAFGGSVVHWTRNQVVALALYGPQQDSNRPPAEYLLLMDDDMAPSKGDLVRLMAHKLDIVYGVCTIRKDPPLPNIRQWNDKVGMFEMITKWDFHGQRNFPIDGGGAAFVLVRRRVFERMGEAYRQCFFERCEDKRKFPNSTEIDAYWDKRAAAREERFQNALASSSWTNCDQWWFQFLDNTDDRQFGEMGEDLSWSWKAGQLGYQMFVDPQITPGHLGTYAYSIRDWVDHQSGLAELGGETMAVRN